MRQVCILNHNKMVIICGQLWYITTTTTTCSSDGVLVMVPQIVYRSFPKKSDSLNHYSIDMMKQHYFLRTDKYRVMVLVTYCRISFWYDQWLLFSNTVLCVCVECTDLMVAIVFICSIVTTTWHL